MMFSASPFDLKDYETFRSHKWTIDLEKKYSTDVTLARYAIARLVEDLESLNKSYIRDRKRVAFITIEGRYKKEDSFFRKLYELCCENSTTKGTTQDTLSDLYSQIRDIAGVRYCCPYYDEIKPTIEKFVRPYLSKIGYATDLRNEKGFEDKDYLDQGDPLGYRSYHFFVQVPTIIDIFENSTLINCEVQARTELQHVWAVKSHNLLYKPEFGWNFSDEHVIEDMRQVSNSLRVADQFMLSIRDRVKGREVK